MRESCKFLIGLAVAAMLYGCSEEANRKGGEKPTPGEEEASLRREVQLTLNNELVLKPTATRAPGDVQIATAEENAISSLDVYVFGSETENGEYTFQERFAYRAGEGTVLPVGAGLLELATTDGTKKESKGLLKLKKGLFVKLYCIANCETLINPATQQEMKDTDFVPLTFTTPGKTGTGVATAGTPTESEFATFHTPLLSADRAADVLQTPLAMAGSYAIPVDLTEFETASRLQLGFKLTRLAARFDIVNNADESRFTITEVAMGNGRRGASFFPIRIYGQAPTAQPGEQITLPSRKFEGTEANRGTQTGAFYSYPSPVGDEGFLILKGIYEVNATEKKEVSYQVPFIQYTDNGGETQLEINHNHRYTIGITKADDYHLDFTLTVADWTDSGRIDDYKPGGDGKAEIEVRIPDTYKDKTTYLPDARIVTMFIKDTASNFDLIVRSTAPLSMQRSYAGGLSAKEYDWLTVSDKTVIGLPEYTYNLKPAKDYTKKRYPKAIFRFTNLADGTETVVFVDAQTAPALFPVAQPTGSFSELDLIAGKMTVYRTTGNTFKVRVSCPDGVQLHSKPDWLDVGDTPEVSGTETTYTFTLNSRDAADTEGTIIFKNALIEEWQLEVAVELKDASVSTTFGNVGGSTGNVLTDASGDTPADVAMKLTNLNTFSVKANSLDYVGVGITYENGSPDWLACSGATTKATTVANDLKFTLKETELAKGLAKKATVTLKNHSGGKDYQFTVTPQFVVPVLTAVSGSATPTLNSFDATNKTVSLYKASGSTIQLKGNALGGTKITATSGVNVSGTGSYQTETTYTIKWDGTTLTGCSLTVANHSDETQSQVIAVTIVDTPVTPVFTDVSGGNAYSTTDKKVTMKLTDKSAFRLTTTSVSGVSVKSIAYAGASDAPQWLSCTQTRAVSESNELSFSLNNNALSAGKTATTATVTLTNTIGGDDFVLTVVPEYQKPVLTTATSVTLTATQSSSQVPTTTISGSCLGGTTIEGEDWITYSEKAVNTLAYSYQLSLNVGTSDFPTALPGQKTITIRNKHDATKSVTVALSFAETSWLAANPSSSEYAEYNGSYGYRFKTSGGTMTVAVYSLFAPATLTSSYDNTYCSSTNGGTTWLTSTLAKTEIVNNRRKLTYQINVAASSGTDAAYQLHKGSVSVKPYNGLTTTYTVWRGASYYGYPAGVGSSYYTAIKKGSYWWAPVNCGATKVAAAAYESNSRGNYYQWGRKDATNPECATFNGRTASTTPNNNTFYTGEKEDWLTTNNNTLWQNGTNDPCPSGYRVPTETEVASWGSASSTSGGVYKVNASTGFPQLIFPQTGRKMYRDGTNVEQTSNTYIWTSTYMDAGYARSYAYGPTGGSTAESLNPYKDYRSFGFVVRCIRK